MINEFGKKIKDQRIHLNLSLRKVCESVLNDGKPISVSYLNDIEQGYRNPPSGDIVVQLANKLGLDRHDLLNLAGKVDPVIEDVVSKEVDMAVLYRRIATDFEKDPKIIQKINSMLDNQKKSK